ncbi:CheR family methyltransferase [Tahibacter amnicola]|uniref:Tetratricopeptide repeat protein n=1 Tax=Tahibacter amnicola TaxID=2976241 RepID=A0ABY6BG65_9GAMM|nr:CheR family methyltransferase [Tahibacter amnicola]UXI68596.1 tetratricopeptide repeat protein [Tahibacter amnicola]
MSRADIENRLKLAMGLDAASIGSSSIDRAVRNRMRDLGAADLDQYWNILCRSAVELQELIEAVVVPETWFFRDREAFNAMVSLLQQDLAHLSGASLRLLSLPCSTGEEPYSMAMALLDNGFAADRFKIDAVDISERALALARRGIYGQNSFRGAELEFRDRHFDAVPGGYRVRDDVRAQVTLRQGNLFADDFLPGSGMYTVVFCRNVLIYFDRATQDRAMSVLDRLMAEKGLLFVAPSETGLVMSHGYVSIKFPLAFGFRRGLATPPKVAAPREKPAPRVATPRTAPPPKRPAAPVAVGAPAPRKPEPVAAPPEGDIEQAERLADQGHLVEAAKLCNEVLRKQGPSARAFQLLGLVREATGNLPEAIQYYRKALYLDPSHQEVLVHLAYLLEKQGDAKGARLLRERAQRATGAVSRGRA